MLFTAVLHKSAQFLGVCFTVTRNTVCVCVDVLGVYFSMRTDCGLYSVIQSPVAKISEDAGEIIWNRK